MNESSEASPGPSSAGPPRAAAPRCEISLQNPNRYGEVNAELRRWLAELVAELAPEAGSLAVRFVGDRAMRRLNRDFRGKDQTTDVLSFPGDLPPRGDLGKKKAKGEAARPAFPSLPGMAGDHLGDLVISLPQTARQAEELGHPLGVELRILLLHGILHCLGYDHEVDDGTMNRVEAALRRRFVGEMSFLEGSES